MLHDFSVGGMLNGDQVMLKPSEADRPRVPACTKLSSDKTHESSHGSSGMGNGPGKMEDDHENVKYDYVKLPTMSNCPPCVASSFTASQIGF